MKDCKHFRTHTALGNARLNAIALRDVDFFAGQHKKTSLNTQMQDMVVISSQATTHPTWQKEKLQGLCSPG